MITSRTSIVAILCLFLLRQLPAQVIPDSLRVNWSAAGYNGSIPDPGLIINVRDFGAYGDNVHDDYNAIMNAVNSSGQPRVIFFPAGNYLIKSTLNIPGKVILRGEGVSSNLRFDLSQYKASTNCINVTRDQSGKYTAINSGYLKGSGEVNVKNSSGFVVNGYAEIKENNGDWDPDKSNSYVGQIVKITAINGNHLSFSPALRINYIDSLLPKIRPLNLVENVGMECFKLTRVDPPNGAYAGKNMVFKYAGNCWVTGVESNYCQAVHIAILSSIHITVSGCYIHDGFSYDGGGDAYGVFMHSHTSDSKLENSIFERLRHAMILASGANGNVYAYNYSTDPKSTTEFPPDNIGDLSLHGHYAYANLFEGNIVQNIIADDYWGASGPYNTFFRNRAELYGIEILDQYGYAVKSDRQNLVGNEVTNTGFNKGNYILYGSNHFTYANNIKNKIEPAGTGNLVDVSYYLKDKPYFWNTSAQWPSIGGLNTLNSGSNPARDRYFSGQGKVSCIKLPSQSVAASIVADSIKCHGGTSKITVTASGGKQPYLGTGAFYRVAGFYTFVVTDASGSSDSVHIKVGEPEPISASIVTAPSQSCKLTGSVTVANTMGGHQPYYFSLDGVNYTSDSIFQNIASGIYKAWIKDVPGCIDSIENITVESVPTITIIARTTRAGACIDDGTITVKRTGGKAPFQYSINNANYLDTNIFTGLAPGVYTVWVKDRRGCVDSLNNIVVSQAKPIKISIQKINVSCINGNDGQITIKATGGKKPYLYSLDTVNYASGNVFANLPPGTYQCRVKDSKTCTAMATAVIKNSKVACPVNQVLNTVNDYLDNGLEIAVSPNPSTRKFVLTLKSSSNMPIAFFVTDSYGRKMYSAKGLPGKYYAFGENLSPGVYTIKLIQGEATKTYRIIKE